MPSALADLLAKEGHDVDDALSEDLGGAPDSHVLRCAGREGRALLTFDTDFANIREYPVGTHSGITVFRLCDQRWATLEEAVQRLLRQARLEELEGALVVVAPGRIRVRRPQDHALVRKVAGRR